MKLLITVLLTLIPFTASAESRGGITVGPSPAPHAGGTIPFALQGTHFRLAQPHLPHVRGFHGRAMRPLIGSTPVQNLTSINMPAEHREEPPPPPPKPSAPAKFWIARCGSFIELQVGPTMNLMEEEQKSCPN